MALTLTQINQLYVSYFGRPADFAGANFYQSANATPTQVAAAFAASAESQALYGNLSVGDQVNTIYQNLFGRSAEVAGLTYWSSQIAQGNISLASAALVIGNAAQNADATVLTNKVLVANSFTTALDTTQEILGYSGTAAAASARTFLSSVNATNLTTAQAQVNTQVAAAVQVATTTSLTASTNGSLDAIVGTARDEFFVGNVTTIQAGDTINGNGGTDTFVYGANSAGTTAVNGFILPTLTNVQQLQFNAPAATTINVSGVSGLTNVGVVDGATGTTVTTASGVSTTFGTATAGTTIAALTAATTGATATVGVTGGLTATTLTVTDSTLATLNLSSNGSANTITTLTATPAAITSTTASTLNVTGSAKLTITNAVSDNFAVINASGNTGGVDITVGTLAVTATGGSGNDRFNFGTTLTSADKVDGGAGTNTISVTGADFTAGGQAAQLAGINAVTNIQTLEFAGSAAATVSGGTATTSLTNTGITKILFNTADSGTDTVQLAGSARTYAFGSSNTGNASLTMTSGVSTVNLSIEGGAVKGNVGTVQVAASTADITATPSLVETINLVSTGTTSGLANTVGGINTYAGSTIKITGSQDLAIAAVTNKAIIDASAFTGKLAITGSTGADVITLGSAADTVTVGFTAAVVNGSGVVTTPGTAGSTYTNLDTINGFVKADTLVLTGAAASTTSLVKFDATNSVSFEQALVSAEQAITGSATASYFNFGGNTYVVANTDTTNSVTATGSTDLVVKIAGVQTLTADSTGIHGA